jgi:hypothetical protein
MFDPQHQLVFQRLAKVAAQLVATPADTSSWSGADEAVATVAEKEPDLARIVAARDLAALQALLAEWTAGTKMLPEQDRGVLHSALKAFKKSMKLMRLDDESRIGGGPMSSGRKSAIVGIVPPARFDGDVWEELVRTHRLRRSGQGIYEMPPTEPPPPR